MAPLLRALRPRALPPTPTERTRKARSSAVTSTVRWRRTGGSSIATLLTRRRRSAAAGWRRLFPPRGADEARVRQAAEAQPSDLDAQSALADLEMVRGRIDEALRVLLDLVRRT